MRWRSSTRPVRGLSASDAVGVALERGEIAAYALRRASGLPRQSYAATAQGRIGNPDLIGLAGAGEGGAVSGEPIGKRCVQVFGATRGALGEIGRTYCSGGGSAFARRPWAGRARFQISCHWHAFFLIPAPHSVEQRSAWRDGR